MYQLLTPPLVSLHWDITNACNFKCVFCGNASGSRLTNELTTEQGFRLVDEATSNGVHFLKLLGGEPFIRDDFIELVEYAVSKGLQISFSTNGSLIDSKIVKNLWSIHSSLTHFQVSLYGTCHEDYKSICGSAHFFDKVCNGIELLSNAGMNPTIFCVVTKQNISHLSRYLELAVKLGAKSFRVARALPQGRADISHCPTYPEFYHSVQKLVNETNMNIPIELTEYSLLADFLEKTLPVQVLRLSCSAALNEMYISSIGLCRPCPFGEPKQSEAPSDIWHYPESTLSEIWNSPSFNYFRSLHDKIRKSSPHTECKYLKTKECNPCVLSDKYCSRKIEECLKEQPPFNT